MLFIERTHARSKNGEHYQGETPTTDTWVASDRNRHAIYDALIHFFPPAKYKFSDIALPAVVQWYFISVASENEHELLDFYLQEVRQIHLAINEGVLPQVSLYSVVLRHLLQSLGRE